MLRIAVSKSAYGSEGEAYEFSSKHCWDELHQYGYCRNHHRKATGKAIETATIIIETNLASVVKGQIVCTEHILSTVQ